MKTNKPAASKLVAKFDSMLRDILMEDLKAYRAKTQFTGTKQGAVRQDLSAA